MGFQVMNRIALFLSLRVRRLKKWLKKSLETKLRLSIGEFDDVFLTNSLPLTNNLFRQNSIIGVHHQTQPVNI